MGKMRARPIPSKQSRQLAARAIEEERIGVCRIFAKIAAVVLWAEFGFGQTRGQRFLDSLFRYLERYYQDYGADFELKLDQELQRANIAFDFKEK